MIRFFIKKNNTKSVVKRINDKTLNALEVCGGKAESYAKKNLTKNHSVDTGTLRNSVSHKVDPLKEVVYIGTNVEYAPYVEFGTGKHYNNEEGGRHTAWTWTDKRGVTHKSNGQKAKPYLKPAVADHKDKYKQILDNAIHDI